MAQYTVLTRKQLAQFLPNHETIVAFENLLKTALIDTPTNMDDILISVGSSLSIGNETLSFSSRITEGSGLDYNGDYTPNGSAHYISTATDLNNADVLLDSKLYDVIQRVVSITGNYTALVGNYSILADATGGSITVTLPLASTATAYIIGITKLDTSTNTITIARSGIDTIIGDTSQTLLYDKEVLNLISDGTNWQLAN